MGASIGLKGYDKESGTLGGYLILQDPSTGERGVFGLTCWHVVRPAGHPDITRKPMTLSALDVLTDLESYRA